MAARQLPMPDDRRDPDAQLFRELYERLHDLGAKVNTLADRMEAVTGLAAHTEINREEIGRIRDSLDTIFQRITTLEAQKDKSDEAGTAIRIRPAVVTVTLAVATFLMKAFYDLWRWADSLKKAP